MKTTIGVVYLVLVLWWAMSLQSCTCTTAPLHAHDQIREAQIQVTSWSGCTLSGVVAGVNVQLWADGSTCGLRDKVPGTFQVRFDETCKQVIDLSDGPLPPYCPPSPTPTPVISPTPAPTPLPTPTTDDCVIDAPASVLLPPNSSSQVTITLTSTTSRTRTVTAVSDSGQVFVSPASQSVSGTSALVGFTLRPKKRGAQVTFSIPSSSCVPRTMIVNVR